ncbi:HEXXH motif domain-containing protein [Actinomadura craniellae]|uniref:HEXXH motif domain-containing protein n=1 Tax=Actinomadura craniellae TaxID=2231787 RepID=UPI0013145F81|nr:HEXXH motif domain-containing protein [Actinomadura craniellae]
MLELARGRAGPEAVRLLTAAQHSKRKLLLRGLIQVSTPADRVTGAGYALLLAAERADARAVARVLDYPAVGAWLWHTLKSVRAGGPRTPVRHIAAVAAAAALRARVDFTLDIAPGGDLLHLPSLGAVRLPGRTTEPVVVRASGGIARITWADRAIDLPEDLTEPDGVWQPVRRLSLPGDGSGWHPVLDDLHPSRFPALPVKERLTEDAFAAWRRSLGAAWSVLRRDHRERAEEIQAWVRVLVPLAPPRQGWRSASSPELFGCIGWSRMSDPVTLAAALVHETQHVKLSALLDVAALVRDDHTDLYYAPWREDPRPLHGLIQGIYAHLSLTDFWRRRRECRPESLRAHASFARWREDTRRACADALNGAGLHPLGRVFVEEVARTLGEWSAEPVPPEAGALAAEESRLHLTRWRRNHAP